MCASRLISNKRINQIESFEVRIREHVKLQLLSTTTKSCYRDAKEASIHIERSLAEGDSEQGNDSQLSKTQLFVKTDL